jgi:hypothetical protein
MGHTVLPIKYLVNLITCSTYFKAFNPATLTLFFVLLQEDICSTYVSTPSYNYNLHEIF